MNENITDVKVGELICDILSWNTGDNPSALWFDQDTQTILIEEEMLLKVILLVNLYQAPRKLKLVTRDEMMKYREKR